MHQWARALLITVLASGAYAQEPQIDAPTDHRFHDGSSQGLVTERTDQSNEMQPNSAPASPQPARTDGGSSGSTNTPDYSDREESSGTLYQASPYVPLDSWVYEVFDRLAALGYAPSSSATVRPWTRLECARLLAEARNDVYGIDEVATPILAALDEEFAFETAVIDGKSNREGLLESVYSRFTNISGTPLRDSYHFGQTIADDFGRPYGKGANEISGFSARGSAGMVSVYFRGEHQYAPTIPTYNLAAQQAIVVADNAFVQGGQMPFGWNLRLGTTDRVRLVEGYAAVNFANWQISFGQQALWWGPDRSTSLILSNNAAALPMLRLARVKPIKLPRLLSWFGPVHVDSFFAREGGIHFVGLGPNFELNGNATKPLTPPPYLWGFAFSVKPTKQFELGFAHTVIFAGYGRPLNLSTFLHSFSIIGSSQPIDPGKRATEFNFAYHVPWLRKNVIAYTEGLAWDNPVEGKFVARFAMGPGLYFPTLPGLKNLDLRVEGAYTDLPKLTYQAYFYQNAHYAQGYTNYGQIMGSWIGRQGAGGQGTSTYWFTPRNKALVTYRRMTADKSFLQGGNLSDISVSGVWVSRSNIELSVTGQYEHWHFPLLNAISQSNFSTFWGVSFSPKQRLIGRSAELSAGRR